MGECARNPSPLYIGEVEMFLDLCAETMSRTRGIGSGVSALALALGLLTVGAWARAPACGLAEPWAVSQGLDPVRASRGNVTLVALLDAS